MKLIFLITLLVALHVDGQQTGAEERAKIFRHVCKMHIDKGRYVINETVTSISKYDVDGNYQRWFYQPFQSITVCVNPIKYESTVIDLLHKRKIQLDTTSIYQQIENPVLDSLSHYGIAAKLISIYKAPTGRSFISNLLKKKSAVGLSPVYFDESNKIAFVKLQVYARKKQSVYNPSKIIVLKKQGEEWETLDVIPSAQ